MGKKEKHMSEEQVQQPAAQPDQVVADEVASSEEPSGEALEARESSESSEQPEATSKEAKEAASKLKAKEVKGSDGEMFTIKVDGEEIKLSKDEMIKHAQMGKAGQRAMQEKAELQKRTAVFIEALKKNPREVLSDPAIGVDVIKFAQEVLAQQLEQEALSPEQKRIKELEADLEKRISKEKEDDENRKKNDYESEVKKYEEDLQIKIQDALDAEKLPRKPAVLAKIAEILIIAHDKKLNINPRSAAKLAKEALMDDLKQVSNVLPDEDLESFFGTELISRIRKASLKKVKSVVPSTKIESTSEGINGGSKPKEAKKIHMNDFIKSVYYGNKK